MVSATFAAASNTTGQQFDWVQLAGVIVAVIAIVVTLSLSIRQRSGDNMVAANSVLLKRGNLANALNVQNAGSHPIANIRAWIHSQSVDELDWLVVGQSVDILFDGHVDIGPDFPHGISVTFADARSQFWEKRANSPARRLGRRVRRAAGP